MARLKYMHIKYYDQYLENLKKRNQEFDLAKTSYSRKIKQKGLTLFFNEDGGSDVDSLGLINMVRDNAKNYLSTTSYQQREQKNFIHFSELIHKPNSSEVIHKIDVRSAYWNAALKRDVILEATDRKLKEIFEFKPAEDMKRARLKALGSLATKSIKQQWRKGPNGKSILAHEEVIVQNTRDLYMDICRDVDALMRDCVNQNERVVFYYWDCIFVPDGFEQGVYDYFKDRKYDVHAETTKLEFIKIKNIHYLISLSDDKAYLVKKESRGLIEGIL